MSWRIGREPSVLAFAGPRALLLQVAHPLVAAGVEQHSDYRTEPFRRAWRTLDWLFKVQFSDPTTIQRHSEMLRAVHGRVKGVSDDGTAYDAMDPALLLWVWATIVDSMVVAYGRLVTPLADGEKERYYQEQKLVGYTTGIPAGGVCPDRWADFRRYVDHVIDNDLRVTATTREVAHGAAPFFRPPVSAVLAPVDSFLAAALLPRRLRAELGLAWGPPQRTVLGALCSANRLGCQVVPTQLRHSPAEVIVRRRRPLHLRPPRLLRRTPTPAR
ncbi:MAG TPA: oxygenase MpaB family protein [Acidimicrobiales bacterium]|nr:oxygenase MpaB family protein [Acidimicrobiales bacterium]